VSAKLICLLSSISWLGLFEFQVIGDFIAGLVMVGSVFFLTAAGSFFDQFLDFGAQGLFLFLQAPIARGLVFRGVDLEFGAVQADMI
jgi:hypothetical protein